MLSNPYLLASSAIFALAQSLGSAAYDTNRNDNLVVYWGQNSYGAKHPSDTTNWQKHLSDYCGDDSVVNAFPIAFLTHISPSGGLPSINLANICAFPGEWNCKKMDKEIKKCQDKGKIVTISLGGAGSVVKLTSGDQAKAFADQLWNLVFGGTSPDRPFGDAVLDGVDLDIEAGGSEYYDVFLDRLQTHFKTASKKYYVTASPQCPYPDKQLQAVLDAVIFDAIYVQFYNNYCGLNYFDSAFNFKDWQTWATTKSKNPHVKIFLGAPASDTAAGQGYVGPEEITKIIQKTQPNPSFGGVMLWDMSQAYMNHRYDKVVKKALTGSSNFDASGGPASCANNEMKYGDKGQYAFLEPSTC